MVLEMLYFYLVNEREDLTLENEVETLVKEKEGQIRIVDGRDETEVCILGHRPDYIFFWYNKKNNFYTMFFMTLENFIKMSV